MINLPYSHSWCTCGCAPRIVIICNPEIRRTELFLAALTQSGFPAPCIVPWIDLLTGKQSLEAIIQAGDVVRLDSSGKCFDVERELLVLGAEAAADDPYCGEYIPAARARRLEFDRGRMLSSRQKHLGFLRALSMLREQLCQCAPHQQTHDLTATALMFDKPQCHVHLAEHNVPQPRLLGHVTSFENLRILMKACGCSRVFVKPAHGSSGAGIVAYRTGGARHSAVTTVEIARSRGETVLYNTRRLRQLVTESAIAETVDLMSPHFVFAEEWLPKASLQDGVFDLRVLTIAGEPTHIVPRVSRSPITNLHLLNERGSVDEAAAAAGSMQWNAMLDTCRRAAAAFPHNLTAGIDVAFSQGFHSHAVLEVNAFGDLLPGIIDALGRDSCTAQLDALVPVG